MIWRLCHSGSLQGLFDCMSALSSPTGQLTVVIMCSATDISCRLASACGLSLPSLHCNGCSVVAC